MYLSEPEEILMNFVRSKLSELTRTTPSLSNRQTTGSKSFSGNGALTIFTLTDTPVAINSVTVGGTEVYPYQDYNIDLDSKKIKFRTAPGSGTNNVVVSYEKGSNWVYTDKPISALKKSSYPRVGITKITESSKFKECGATTTHDPTVIQFDFVSYKDLLCTISTETRDANDITAYLARTFINLIKTHWQNYLSYKIRIFKIVSNNPAPFEPNPNITRRVVEIMFEFRNMEEVL